MSKPVQNIRNLIDLANDAMINSDVPVRFTEFCIQEIDLQESPSSSQRLRDLINAAGGVDRTLNTADIAILMAGSQAGSVAGQVMNIGPGGTPVGWAAQSFERVAFPHEIGHIFGARHNR